jgi:hypothetical protein
LLTPKGPDIPPGLPPYECCDSFSFKTQSEIKLTDRLSS